MNKKKFLENEMDRMNKVQDILLSSIHNNAMAKEANGLSIFYTSIKEFRENFMVIHHVDAIGEFIDEDEHIFTGGEQ